MEKHPLHLKNPELQTSPEVERAVEREEWLTGESVPNDPAKRIEAYIDRLENIFLNPDERVRERNLEMFRDKIYDALIIKRDIAAEQILKDEAKAAFDRGCGRIEITEEMKNRPETQEQAEAVIRRQETSLNEWMEYLTSDDASSYDPWFKYYLWNSIIKLQSLVKIEKTDERTGERTTIAKYPERSASTLKPFPDIYRGKLSQIYDKYNLYLKGEKTDKSAKEYFQRNFAKTYAEESLDHITHASFESKEQTRGEWIKYEKGDMTGAERMIASLQNKYTDWCIEGEGVGKDKLNEGDIYIYYTYDESGNPVNPRLCIRKSGDHIAEIRGISGGKDQEVEQVFMDETGEGGGVLSNKLKEFGNEADKYNKREADMKYVTRLIKKNEKGELFTEDDLAFLYEIDSPIEGFGYQKDPRVAELRAQRNKEKDMLTIFECSKDKIAYTPDKINENTKAYVGEWNPTVLQTIKQFPSIKHLYESFPEKKIFKQSLETDPNINSPEKAEKAMIAKNLYLSDRGKDILYKTEFSHEEKTYELARFTVEQLGFPKGATIAEIIGTENDRDENGNHAPFTSGAMTKLGLELCPAEVGPHLRLQYSGGEWMLIAMKQITGYGGAPDVFRLARNGERLGLDADNARRVRRWSPGGEFVFCFRKET